ncbi:MAG: DUF4920 domain-containing protein [Planctomycetota bacterium]|jgi:hypothetical protein
MRYGLATVALVLLVGCGSEKKVASVVYGQGVNTNLSIRIADLHERADDLLGQFVRVEGRIVDVCPRRGCWIELAGEKAGETLTVKVKDGVIVFPTSIKGQHAVVEGTVQKLELDLEQTRKYYEHKAMEKGEEFDTESVTEPATIVRLAGTGAIVRDAE